MALSKAFKFNSKRIILSVLLSIFPITTQAMLQSWKKPTSSIAQHLATRNLYTFGNFNSILAPISSQSSFNSNNSKANKWAAAGILGTLGISTIAINQDSQKNTEFNTLISELQNNKTINQENKNQPATTNKPKRFMFNPNNNGLLAGATAQFKNFIRAVTLHMDELDRKPSYNTEATNKLLELMKEKIYHCLNGPMQSSVKKYIKEGANVNAKDKDGNTPLHYAAKYGGERLIKLLVKNGADVNAKDKYNHTPLYCATYRNRFNITNFLEKCRNKDFQYRNNDKYYTEDYYNQTMDKYRCTPLHKAIRKCDEETIKNLIEKGADVNAQDRLGDTSLHYAAAIRDANIIKLLIKNGADITAKNKKGSTPYDLAIEHHNQNLNRETIIDLLTSYNFVEKHVEKLKYKLINWLTPYCR